MKDFKQNLSREAKAIWKDRDHRKVKNLVNRIVRRAKRSQKAELPCS